MSTSSKAITKLFVYGTLKEGQRMDIRKFGNDVKFVTVGSTQGKMWTNGFYPAVLFDKEGVVHGEVYTAYDESTLARLDSYEGYPNLYTKKNIVVETEHGEKHECVAYHYNQSVERLEPVSSGVWY